MISGALSPLRGSLDCLCSVSPGLAPWATGCRPFGAITQGRRPGLLAAAPSGLQLMLTPQQQLAVFRREVSVVLSSGAGCGKTHVLTERYLAHLREGADVGQVVAITFTDRAARQMR